MMNMNVFEPLWNVVGDSARMTSNCYRVYVELCLNGPATQKGLCDKRQWKKSSVSNTIHKLYDLGIVDCRAENRQIVYFAKTDLVSKEEKGQRSVYMSMETFKKLWEKVSDISQMTANCYRVYIDICLYGATTQKDLWERRDWKIAGVSSTFHRLYDMGLLDCNISGTGQKLYSAKLNFKTEENIKED